MPVQGLGSECQASQGYIVSQKKIRLRCLWLTEVGVLKLFYCKEILGAILEGKEQHLGGTARNPSATKVEAGF